MNHFDYALLADVLKRKGITNEQVLNAIKNTPRHQFMPENMRQYALEDTALPIGENQTISQPYVVARMTEALLEHGALNNVLEIGTGSGYQAAILSQVANNVYSIERIQSLYESANKVFESLELTNIQTRYSDGHFGWPEKAPFDGIIVTAATNEIPNALLDQLANNANLIIPVGDALHQTLQCVTRKDDHFTKRGLDSVIFVPLKPGTKHR